MLLKKLTPFAPVVSRRLESLLILRFKKVLGRSI